MLTSELKIRTARPDAPHWDALLTEGSFAGNVTPHEELDFLSPFNLVFGRRPRLSPDDICFPTKSQPLPLPKDAGAARHLSVLHKRLAGL